MRSLVRLCKQLGPTRDADWPPPLACPKWSLGRAVGARTAPRPSAEHARFALCEDMACSLHPTPQAKGACLIARGRADRRRLSRRAARGRAPGGRTRRGPVRGDGAARRGAAPGHPHRRSVSPALRLSGSPHGDVSRWHAAGLDGLLDRGSALVRDRPSVQAVSCCLDAG